MERFIILNWKTYIATTEEAVALAQALPDQPTDTFVVCPSAVHYEAVAPILSEKGIHLGAQDIAPGAGTAQTGRHSGTQLHSFGVSYCLVGHPETRRYGVTDAMVAEKVLRAQESGIRSVVCLTSLKQVEAMRTAYDVLSGTGLSDVVFAYEPEEYIGAGEAIPTEELRRLCDDLRQLLTDMGIADAPVLYGGSVHGENVERILTAGVDGFLVGGAGAKQAKLEALLSAL